MFVLRFVLRPRHVLARPKRLAISVLEPHGSGRNSSDRWRTNPDVLRFDAGAVASDCARQPACVSPTNVCKIRPTLLARLCLPGEDCVVTARLLDSFEGKLERLEMSFWYCIKHMSRFSIGWGCFS